MVKNKGHSSKHIVALTMQHAGSSITITSISNAVVFFVACVIPVTALRNLLMAAATVRAEGLERRIHRTVTTSL